MGRGRRTLAIISKPSIAVLGLGYVGSVSAACLASMGMQVVGVDVNPDKVERMRRGLAPIVEDDIDDVVARAVSSGALRLTVDTQAALAVSDIAMVCVGTPSTDSGALSTTFLEQVTGDIGASLKKAEGWRAVVYRSTMLPGTCQGLLIPILERVSGKRAGIDFGVCVNPEYLREGTSVRDFFNPPKTVIGATDDRTADLVSALYEGMPGEVFKVSIPVAEMTKYADNSFHAMKVAFANELGAICAAVDVDSRALMDVFVADTKLNLSRAYLRPGFAFGGSCLPKDIRALTSLAHSRNMDIPLIGSLLDSNESHLRRVLNTILAAGRRDIGIFGLSFKPGTDDLRESPMVELAERLIGKGFTVKIYDAGVQLSLLTGANKAFVEERLPHLAGLLAEDAETVATHGDLLVVWSTAPEVADAVSRHSAGKFVLDLVGLSDAESLFRQAEYHRFAG